VLALVVLALLLAGGCGGPAGEVGGRAAPAAAGAAGSGGTNDPEHRDAPYVVLVSLDGFRWDYDRMYPAPNLRRMAETGARADRLIPAFPTKTFPTHYSIATGLYAENHGLVGNRFWDPERQAAYGMGDRSVVEDGAWYRGEPIWVTAETQGMVAASYFFVGSEADVGGVRPTHWRRYDGSVPNEARVDQVLEWLSFPEAERPHLVTLYFSDVDGAGHRYGPGSPEVGTAVAEVDRMLGRLLDGVESLPHGDRVYVLVVSDHGMLLADPEKVHVVDPAAMPGVRVAELGPYASFFVEGGREAAVRLRDSLRTAIPAADVWLREEVPERFHYSDDPRIGDVVALMEPEWTVAPPDRIPFGLSWTHGWDNRLESMGGIFFAVGPDVRRGLRLEPFESVHVYPFVAHLLGLKPAPVDGRLEVLAPLLDETGEARRRR
jgi:predicted AlkP superfamily pyrophosphatase or phosphodiesterase